MRKLAKYTGTAILLLMIVWAGAALGQALSASAGADVFEPATMSPYITQPPAAEAIMEEAGSPEDVFVLAMPTPTPLAMGWDESGDMFSGITGSLLTVKAYASDGTLLASSTGTVVFDNYTIAVTANLLEGAARLEAYSKAGYTYQITKVIAVEPHTGVALLEFQSPTDLKPLLPGEAVIKEGSLIDLIGQDAAEGLFWKEGKVSAFSEEGVTVIQCTLDIPGGFFGGVLLNKLGDIIGLPYAYKRDADLCYALDIADLQALFVSSRAQPRTVIGNGTADAFKTDAGDENTGVPQNLTAVPDGLSIVLAWDSALDAARYYVYRSQGDEDVYYQLGYVLDPPFTDESVKMGMTYTYTVRAVYPTRMSDYSKAAKVTVHDTYMEPAVPLEIGGDAFLSVENGMPCIDLSVENTSRTKTVTGFSLAIFLKDEQEQYVRMDDGTDYYAYFDISASMEPMGSAFTGPLYLKGFSNVKYINVAITGVRMLDGEQIDIPKEEWAYSYWYME